MTNKQTTKNGVQKVSECDDDDDGNILQLRSTKSTNELKLAHKQKQQKAKELQMWMSQTKTEEQVNWDAGQVCKANEWVNKCVRPAKMMPLLLFKTKKHRSHYFKANWERERAIFSKTNGKKVISKKEEAPLLWALLKMHLFYVCRPEY